MKIITNNGIWIQKKDLELIFKVTNNVKIPNNIIERYKENIALKALNFIFFEAKEEIDFLNAFWFIINYNDIIDFNDLEITDYYYRDLQNLRAMRVEFEKHKFLPQKKHYSHFLDMLFDQAHYECYMPSKDEAQNYPLAFQLLYNKVSDVMELKDFKNGQSKLELPEEIFKPIRYTTITTNIL